MEEPERLEGKELCFKTAKLLPVFGWRTDDSKIADPKLGMQPRR